MEEAELRRLIDFLVQRREILNATIADLEQLSKSTERIAKRPGRKSVDMEERLKISERMKARWAQRRSNKGSGTGAGA
jgi:hypothetical protein